MIFYRRGQVGKRNKWLNFGSYLHYDPALAEVCALEVLGIWCLSVMGKERYRMAIGMNTKASLFSIKFTAWENKILHRVGDAMAMVRFALSSVFLVIF